MKASSYIGQGHEVMPKLHMTALNCIGEDHQVVLELRMYGRS